ncbi:amidohydrolase family protein [Aequorivita sp. SDUM287046]|uniref:Amidohydrolase family protein n=1 Tax=Aequorivita aurantiaca TaxID=3053356 RepID=A0ABT8DFR5_9FLAO|nr:amidohydrolase family protein [Aequorivita aurantiaca]MDN3724196.1 amidohydrolase family protein [Aequorivita aurantiaca]
MKKIAPIIGLLLFVFGANAQKIFDVHIHGNKNPTSQLAQLASNGVYKAAVSTSWDLQTSYQNTESLLFLHGLMLACPEGKVPYSLQFCFSDQREFPDIDWVEQLIKENKIQFLGEVLNQYYGISPSDEKLFPYYALAEKYNIPVGIHTGLAGPEHGSPNFKISLGTPLLLENLLQRFPKLKVWIMHAGAPFIEDSIAIMKYYPNVYADISAINNPYIFPKADFEAIMNRFIDAGLEDRLMFGSDNGDIKSAIASIEDLVILNDTQKRKIYYENAELFFAR